MDSQTQLFDAGPPQRPAMPARTCTPFRPGTGPAGETCRTCRHLVRVRLAGTYLKCGLMRLAWTHGGATDIKAGWPACGAWESAKG
jgi:hypothetical protein